MKEGEARRRKGWEGNVPLTQIEAGARMHFPFTLRSSLPDCTPRRARAHLCPCPANRWRCLSWESGPGRKKHHWSDKISDFNRKFGLNSRGGFSPWFQRTGIPGTAPGHELFRGKVLCSPYLEKVSRTPRVSFLACFIIIFPIRMHLNLVTSPVMQQFPPCLLKIGTWEGSSSTPSASPSGRQA